MVKPITEKEKWLPNLNLTQVDRENISNKNDLDDYVILSTMNLLQIDYPTLIIQPPCLTKSSGYVYCPHETIQITHNGAPHWYHYLLSEENSPFMIVSI